VSREWRDSGGTEETGKAEQIDYLWFENSTAIRADEIQRKLQLFRVFRSGTGWDRRGERKGLKRNQKLIPV
jgi:hypothetical protein